MWDVLYLNLSDRFEQLFLKIKGQTVDFDKGSVQCVIISRAKEPIYSVRINGVDVYRIAVKVKTIPLGSMLTKTIYINEDLLQTVVDKIEDLSFKVIGDFIELDNIGNTVLEDI